MPETARDRAETIAWLLEGDPAIRWQVLRDLAGADRSEWEREQGRVATEGWGARLLEHQDRDGRWTAKLYGKKWISTTYSMVLLRSLGLPALIPGRSSPVVSSSKRGWAKMGASTSR
jgi:hypothetical protein